MEIDIRGTLIIKGINGMKKKYTNNPRKKRKTRNKAGDRKASRSETPS